MIGEKDPGITGQTRDPSPVSAPGPVRSGPVRPGPGPPPVLLCSAAQPAPGAIRLSKTYWELRARKREEGEREGNEMEPLSSHCVPVERTAFSLHGGDTLPPGGLVIQPYITGLETELKRRFQELDILGAFHVLRPQSAALPDNMSIAQLHTLVKKFCPDQEKVLLQEWFSFKNHIITGM
ncbi:unnamed protein product [Gadus morhua 'NCC']